MEIANSSGGNKTILWIAGGCLVIILCAIAVIVFGFGGLAWLGSQKPENLNVSLNVPLNAAIGEEFEFEIAITNTGSATMQLMNIDISLNYLDGIAIDHTSPAYTASSQYNALGGGETFQMFSFNQSIAPGETLTIIFSSLAVSAGDHSGNVSVCIDSTFNCAFHIARTVVK
jgi:hypothetical protein